MSGTLGVGDEAGMAETVALGPDRSVLRGALISVLRGVLPALLVGVWVALLTAAPAAVIRANLLGFVTPILIAGFRARRFAQLSTRASVVLACVGLACTALILRDPDAVHGHGWTGLAGVRFHPSSQFAPLVLLAIVDQVWVGAHWTALSLALIAQVLHALSGDVIQACALGAGLCALNSRGARGSAVALSSAALAGVLLTALSASRAAVGLQLSAAGDTQLTTQLHLGLSALSHVPWLQGLALLGVALLFIEPLYLAASANSDARTRTGAIAIVAYWLGCSVAAIYVDQPIPVVGPDAGQVIGAVLAMVWLGARANAGAIAISSSPETRASRFGS